TSATVGLPPAPGGGAPRLHAGKQPQSPQSTQSVAFRASTLRFICPHDGSPEGLRYRYCRATFQGRRVASLKGSPYTRFRFNTVSSSTATTMTPPMTICCRNDETAGSLNPFRRTP